MLRKLKKFFVSETDQFFAEFNHHNPQLSQSQQAEVKKHERIFRLRDNKHEQQPASELWKDF